MGGNAIENAKRMSAEEYADISSRILSFTKEITPKASLVKAYKTKPDFGDIDIVALKPKQERREFELWLNKIGSQQQPAYNNDYISFEFEQAQVDLIYVNEDEFETALFYYSYNDLNNLVGRIAHKFGVKFGWDGLTYQIRTESGHQGKKICLSKDPKEIYEFLGYDYNRYLQGFNNLEDIFEFVVDNKYFNSDIFQYKELNSTNKTRNKKRKTYARFLEWLEEKKEDGRVFNNYSYNEDKSPYLIKIHNAFSESDLLGQLKKASEEVSLANKRSIKFNGLLMAKWSGKEGKELGVEIASFKKWIIEQREKCLLAYYDISVCSQFTTFEAYLDLVRKQDVAADYLYFKRTT